MMKLNQYSASKRREIYEDLVDGRDPREGRFDPEALAEGRRKGRPQMGTVVYRPDSMGLEFVFSDPAGSATILTVALTPPERIVFLPVPEWVVESIWQGEISGAFVFESEAKAHLARLADRLEPAANQAEFERQSPKRRE